MLSSAIAAIALASVVPVKVGVMSLVMLSLLLPTVTPASVPLLSLVVARSPKTAGAEASTVKAVPVLVVLLPAASVTLIVGV